tara:strand:- start:376 stop:1101 length:726 start_codon:yes stop_codon:yes gene_type:complete
MLSFKEHIFKSIASTNSALLKDADLLDEGTVYQALIQKAGKGRAGNKWVSETGNLYLSILLKPDLNLKDASLISFVAALAIANSLEDFDETLDIQLKWPNDVLVGGKKISGILLESDFDSREQKLNALIVGMGINLNHKPQLDTAICLSELLNKEIDIIQFKNTLMENFNAFYTSYMLDGFTFIRNCWLKRAYKLGQEIRVRINDEAIFNATFLDLAEDGQLVAKLDNGEIRNISSAELFF